MIANWLEASGVVRLVFVAIVLATLLGWQRLRPRRGDADPRRGVRNLGLMAIASIVVRLLIPLSAVAFAAMIQARSIGVFPQLLLPQTVAVPLGIVLLDMAIYWQHRCFHQVPLLWRIHRVHHSDTGFDATLGLRFHPVEIALSLLFKFAVIAVLGLSAGVVFIYEILLTGFSLWTHADIVLPQHWDCRLRRVLVTPDWHRVHHSVHRDETDSNYANILSVWDHLFRSDVAQPRDGHVGMRIGLPDFRAPRAQTLASLLLQPLQGEPRTPSTDTRPHA